MSHWYVGLAAGLLALSFGAGAALAEETAGEKAEDTALVGRGAGSYDPERAIFGTLPRYRSEDGAINAGVGFLIQIDAGRYRQRPDAPAEQAGRLVGDLESGARERRAIFLANALLGSDFIFFGSWDLFDRGKAFPHGLRAAMIAYRRFDPVWIVAGQQPISSSLDAAAFSDRSFMESAMSSGAFAWAPGTPSLGVSVSHRSPNHYLRGGVFSVPAKEIGGDREGYGLHGRAAWMPIAERTRALHFGLAGYWRKPTRKPGEIGGGEQFSARPELRVDNSTVVNTGRISRIDDFYYTALELAGVYGPWSLQGEYQRLAISRTNGGGLAPYRDLVFNGYYVLGSYFLTGESRNYYPRFGAFWRVKPHREFDPWSGKEGWGAFELAARVSNIDLDDGIADLAGGGVRGGVSNNYTLALNWHMTPFRRLSLNYVHADIDNRDNGAGAGLPAGGTVDGVALRMQWVF